jgi:hypothetical protein
VKAEICDCARSVIKDQRLPIVLYYALVSARMVGPASYFVHNIRL